MRLFSRAFVIPAAVPEYNLRRERVSRNQTAASFVVIRHTTIVVLTVPRTIIGMWPGHPQ